MLFFPIGRAKDEGSRADSRSTSGNCESLDVSGALATEAAVASRVSKKERNADEL
jgi:hypothetical protein